MSEIKKRYIAPEQQEILLIKYGEIYLRGRNRNLYENMLIDTIRKQLMPLGNYWVKKEQGRFVIECEEGKAFDYDTVTPVVTKIFGIIGACPCTKTINQNIENLKKTALEHMMRYHGDKEKLTFKVDTVRAVKSYPMLSGEVNAVIGEFLLENMSNLSVDVKKPEITLKMELRTNAYAYSSVVKGLGGLPNGSSGKGILLLSGGIDSPVAGFMAAKRGIDITAVYFHSPPYTSERAREKVKDLAAVLAGFTGHLRLLSVPFTDVQLKICDNAPASKLTILLKRSMLHAAEKIAEKESAHCIITGDSIGQVASQTLQSIRAISSAVKAYPIIRPLACLDKFEITDRAQAIGTYDISIRPFEDCCTLFLPDFPETKPKQSIIEHVEEGIEGLAGLIEKAVEEAELFEF